METSHAVHRFTVDEYEQAVEAGLFSRDDRVELVRGLIVDVAAVGSRHAATVKRLRRLFDRALGDRVMIGVQDPIRLPPDSEPEPDLCLLVPRPDFYAEGHPEPDSVLLCVEVAQTSVDTDRDKIALYGQRGVQESWLINLREDRIEIHRSPTADGYATVDVRDRAEVASPLAFPDVEFRVNDIIGSR